MAMRQVLAALHTLPCTSKKLCSMLLLANYSGLTNAQVIGAATLFATHFHELTDLQGPVGVSNRHVATVIDPATGRLTMLYQLRDGCAFQTLADVTMHAEVTCVCSLVQPPA